ncbi:hypothetical protein QR680_015212 [Steinernema hermaphroditum]|uniref:7TM GPCR serpentine receptor class x (Srx) domain-containing protein n=1 Tax=Steinernema hermaphroditum TaxID=289476 RepID=A0AA39M572_9BILA|nr:hypothetical protein QR680_015212 [Steinernema hermaphroditum]
MLATTGALRAMEGTVSSTLQPPYKQPLVEVAENNAVLLGCLIGVISLLGIIGNGAIISLFVLKTKFIFRCSFGTLTVNRCVSNLLGILVFVPIMVHALISPSAKLNPYVAMYSGTILHICFDVTGFCNVLLALNRIAHQFDLKLLSIFQGISLVATTFGIWIVAAVMGSPTIANPCHFAFNTFYFNWAFNMENTCGQAMSLLATFSDYFLAALLTFFNVVIFTRLAYQSYWKFIGNVPRKDRDFCIQELIIGLIYILSMTSVYIRGHAMVDSWLLFILFKLNYFLVICIDPWVTIIINKLMRDRVADVVRSRKNKVQSVSSINVASIDKYSHQPPLQRWYKRAYKTLKEFLRKILFNIFH